MSENPCSKLKRLIEERAPWLEIRQEEFHEPYGKEQPSWVCTLDFKDSELNAELRSRKDPLELIGSLEMDKSENIRSSDLVLSTKVVRAKVPLSPTNVIRFPDGCEIDSIHSYDHLTPTIHLHLKCTNLDEHKLRQFADSVSRITRRSREFCGLER